MQASPTFNKPEVTFYFDVVCPFAYIASERIDDIARFTGAIVTWTPVLLGGLYALTNADQGKAGSASDVLPPSKKAMFSLDFNRELGRYRLPFKFHPQHPVSSVDAGRLLAAFPPEHRSALAHVLYRAYWVDNENIASRATLLRLARSLKLTSMGTSTHSGPFSLTPALPFALDETIFLDVERAEVLRKNTDEALRRGVFGVPAFYIPSTKSMYWGQDRLPLLEAELISIKKGKPISQIRQLERLLPRTLRTPPEDRSRVLKFWFDFSSPWSYLGWSQLERIQRDAGPGLKIVLKPFLLGALFREIGTAMLPGKSMNVTKQAYASKDMNDWVVYWSAVNEQEYPPIEPLNFKFASEFPIRSVTALRVCLLEPKTITAIYRAAWANDEPISNPEVLARVLMEAGFDGKKLIKDVSTGGSKAEVVKEQLKANNDEAIKLGICGAPTFQIGKHLVWGQDRINVVEDLILGWKPETSTLKASVSAFPHYDYRL